MRALLLSMIVSVVGCLAATDPTAPSSSEAAASAPDGLAPAPEAPPPPATPPASCDPAETARLQAGLHAGHGTSTNAVMAVKSACGIRFFASGPSAPGPKQLHRIGSITKTYTAALVLTLAKEGKVGLEDPVSRWVSGIPNGDQIPIRRLLDHTSGLFAYTDDEAFFGALAPDRRWTPEELVGIAARHPPNFAPGLRFEYSNTNFLLLGVIAEAAGGAPFVSLLRGRLLDPLGLGETFLDGSESLGAFTLAPAFDAEGTEATHATEPTWAWAAGAIVATASDTARWIELFATGAFLTDRAPPTATTLVPTESPGVTSGLGVFVFDPSTTLGGGLGIGHDGYFPPYLSSALHLPDKQMTIATIVDGDREMEAGDQALANALSALFPQRTYGPRSPGAPLSGARRGRLR